MAAQSQNVSRDTLSRAAFPQDYDAQAIADARRCPIPALTDTVEGDFAVETYTVFLP